MRLGAVTYTGYFVRDVQDDVRLRLEYTDAATAAEAAAYLTRVMGKPFVVEEEVFPLTAQSEDRTMTDEERAELEALRAENARLKASKGKGYGIKVSDKGGVSVYGLGRFPVTLYETQWTALFGLVDEIKAFIVAHKAELAVKPS